MVLEKERESCGFVRIFEAMATTKESKVSRVTWTCVCSDDKHRRNDLIPTVHCSDDKEVGKMGKMNSDL